jgi:ABC-type transport system involved in Fe-S cluster assembly fused permease/ATPase subunit
MANIYKNAFYDPATTAAETVYTVPTNARAIIQNIQLTNESGTKVAKVSVTDSSSTTDYQIAYADITGPTICNVAKGPVVLEENDILKIESSVTSGISGIISILEINRD